MEQFIPVEIFQKTKQTHFSKTKANRNYRGITFSRFYRNDPKPKFTVGGYQKPINKKYNTNKNK